MQEIFQSTIRINMTLKPGVCCPTFARVVPYLLLPLVLFQEVLFQRMDIFSIGFKQPVLLFHYDVIQCDIHLFPTTKPNHC